MLTQTTVLRRAGRWFLESGIQVPEGGVARYYLSDSCANSRVSNEITGYAVSSLLQIHGATGETAFLSAAQRAARYLVHAAWDKRSSTFPFEPSADVRPTPAYFFDCGIIARALVRLWQTEGEPIYLERAKETALSMAFDFAGDRAPHPVIRLPEKQPEPEQPRWSRQPGCYQLKAALAWLDVAGATGEHSLARAYDRTLEFSLATHAAFLPGDPDPVRVMDRLHAYSYFLEGLLPRASAPECAAALHTGIGRVSKLLRQIAPVFARSDVFAQLLRVRLYAASLGIVDLDADAAAEEALAARSFQIESGNPRCDGGFWFGRKHGQLLPHVNPVSTAFCTQALTMWEEWIAGRREFQASDLI